MKGWRGGGIRLVLAWSTCTDGDVGGSGDILGGGEEVKDSGEEEEEDGE